MTLNDERKSIKNTAGLVFGYTVLFAILIVGIFLTFIMEHKTFVNIYDAYDQGYFWTVELKKNLYSLFVGDGYPAWSWSKGPGMEVKAITDPFMVLATLFPIGYIELGYSLVTVLRLYCSGLAFIAFAREVSLDRYQSLMGAICYTFSAWVINVSLVQAQFVNITILFPLLILSIDRIYKGKSPVPFMLVVAWTMINSVYLAYMAGISSVIYILLRYFTYCERFTIKDYLVKIIKFIAYGLIGIAASAVVCVTTIQALMGASTGGSGSKKYNTMESIEYFFNLGNKFVSEGYSFGYGYIGLPIIGLLVIFVSYRYFSLRKTNLIMTVMFVLMMFFPFFSSMFNGFGYVTTRWYFMLVFFLAWTVAESFDLDKLAEGKNLIIMGLTWIVIVGSTLGFAYLDLSENYSKNGIVFVAGQLLAGLIILIIIALGIKGKTPLIFRQGAVLVVTVGVLVCGWTVSFQNNTDTFVMNNEINKQLQVSTQRAGNQIDDAGFYRIDQVDGINVKKTADQPANENLWWGTRTLYLYDSKVPARLSEFYRLMGNNYGYSKRVYVQSNGNRMGLDFLFGVKYFLGDDLDNVEIGSDQYAGYGFSEYKNIDGVNVFKNKYDSGLGFAYDKVISESEFNKLSRNAREQAILQAMVLPDETVAGLDSEQVLKAADIEISIDDINYQIVAESGAHVDGNTITVDEVAEDEPRAGFSIYVSGVNRSQLVVSFDNLKRVNKSGEDIGDFVVQCFNSKLKATANNKKNNQTIPGIVDYDLNMGYYDSYNGNLKITFNKPGTYTFDKLYVSAMNVDNYDKYATDRLQSKLDVEGFSPEHVYGSIDAKHDGYLFFSIPAYKNWEVWVDDEVQPKITNANITFMAVAINKGKHQIELHHKVQHQTLARATSAGALLLIIIIGIICFTRRKRKQEE